jgi:hypothetical protein
MSSFSNFDAGPIFLPFNKVREFDYVLADRTYFGSNDLWQWFLLTDLMIINLNTAFPGKWMV